MRSYYNDNDPAVCRWLEQLIKNGEITAGDVDGRSIEEIKPADIKGYDRVHLFAGIGTWDYALNQAGWGDRSVWTASLPCQPFSAAGKRLGKKDERHLLPKFLDFVRECKPDTIFGEQVESAIKHGWLDDLQTVMEAEGYAVGHCVLGAHSVNAAHIRQRLYWVANTISNNNRKEVDRFYRETERNETKNREKIVKSGEPGRTGCHVSIRMGNTERPGLERHAGDEVTFCQQGRNDEESDRPVAEASGVSWLYCRDNKYRPVKPGIEPLVDGSAGKLVHSSDTGAPIEANKTQEARAMRLKGYGNTIQVQTAQAFIRAFMDYSW